jgi:hypothetical protein
VSFGTRFFPSFNLSSPVARVNTSRVYADVHRGAMASLPERLKHPLFEISSGNRTTTPHTGAETKCPMLCSSECNISCGGTAKGETLTPFIPRLQRTLPPDTLLAPALGVSR